VARNGNNLLPKTKGLVTLDPSDLTRGPDWYWNDPRFSCTLEDAKKWKHTTGWRVIDIPSSWDGDTTLYGSWPTHAEAMETEGLVVAVVRTEVARPTITVMLESGETDGMDTMINTADAYARATSLPERRARDSATTPKMVPVCHPPPGGYTLYPDDHEDFPSKFRTRSGWSCGLAPEPTIHNPQYYSWPTRYASGSQSEKLTPIPAATATV
jgi:hypothetical protein